LFQILHEIIIVTLFKIYQVCSEFAKEPVENFSWVSLESFFEHADKFDVGLDHSGVFEAIWLVAEHEYNHCLGQEGVESGLHVLALVGLALVLPLFLQILEGSSLSHSSNL